MITSYDQLTIKQYLQLKLIAELESDPLIRKMKMLAEVSGQSLEWAEALPIGELISRLEKLDRIAEIPEGGKVNMKLKAGGKKWILKWRTQDLLGSQYIDSMHFLKDEAKIEKNIHNVLASIAVEVNWYGKELPYDGNNHKERAETFKNELKMAQVYLIYVFFCEYFKTLTDNIQTYLIAEAEKVVKEVGDHLEINGVGLQQ